MRAWIHFEARASSPQVNRSIARRETRVEMDIHLSYMAFDGGRKRVPLALAGAAYPSESILSFVRSMVHDS